MKETTRRAVATRLAKGWGTVHQYLSRLRGGEMNARSESDLPQNDLGAARRERRARRYMAIPLPEPVLTAFAVEPLAAGDELFIGREAELQRVAKALDQWRAGQHVTVSVVGRQGYGTSSFLLQLALLLREGETFRYDRLERRSLDEADTLAMISGLVGRKRPVESLQELLDYLNGLSPRVFAIDNAHYLASRIMGSEEAVSYFGAVMIATQARHLWIVGFEYFAWRRLEYMYRVQRFFDDCIELPAFSTPELAQCFTARLGAAGLVEPGASSDEPGQVPALVATVLPDLARLSENKPDLAFFYFLDALVMGEGSGRLATGPVTPLDFGRLKRLDKEDLFTLAEVAAHGRMTVTDHRAVFRTSHQESWLWLEHLYLLCLLDRDEGDVENAYYRLMPLYSRVITQFLTNANYLY